MIKEKNTWSATWSCLQTNSDFWFYEFCASSSCQEIQVKQGLAEYCERIDIVFDLYHQKSIKENEPNRRGKQTGILTGVSHVDQALPVAMDKFCCFHRKTSLFSSFFSLRRKCIKLYFQDVTKKSLVTNKSFWNFVKPFLNNKSGHSQNDIMLIYNGKVIVKENNLL